MDSFEQKLIFNRVREYCTFLRDQWLTDKIALDVSIWQTPDHVTFATAKTQVYTPIKDGHGWGGAWSSAWFRLSGSWPKEWSGRPVSALIQLGAEGCIHTESGPQQGIDSNHSDYVITESADGAGEVTLWIEAAANLPEGKMVSEELSHWKYGGASVACFNKPAFDLYHDLAVLVDVAQQLDATATLRIQLLKALDAAITQCKVHGLAAAAPVVRRDLTVYLNTAAPEHDLSYVSTISQSHIDLAWLWPARETIRKCIRTFSTALALLDKYPKQMFLHTQPQSYAWVKERSPQLYARIKRLVAQGRWIAEGAFWVEPDVNMPCGESLIRQIVKGKNFFKTEFGTDPQIAWLPDTFGFPASMPQIFAGCGVPYFYTTKLSWNKQQSFPRTTFWWEGIDGTRILAHQSPMFGSGEGEQALWIKKGEVANLDRDRVESWIYMYGFGDGGGGPTKTMVETVARCRSCAGITPMRYESPTDWFKKVSASATQKNNLRTWRGELYLDIHQGTLTSQAAVKMNNRVCETLLHDAEALWTIALIDNKEYPKQSLDGAWQTVLFNQFHDILPGSSITMVYEQAEAEYAKAKTEINAIIADRIVELSKTVTCGLHKAPVVAVNTLWFERSGIAAVDSATLNQALLAQLTKSRQVQISEHGTAARALFIGQAVPAFGHTVMDLADAPAIAENDVVRVTGNMLENSLIRAQFNDRGELISLVDKKTRREVVDQSVPGNEFQLFDEKFGQDNAWDIPPDFDKDRLPIDSTASITIEETGPLQASLRVERVLSATSKLVQIVRLQAFSRRIDFDTQVVWEESHKLLKVAFPLALCSDQAAFEVQYGHCLRSTHSNTVWEQRQFEVAGQRFADISENDFGVALLNNGRYGYDVRQTTVRLSLLRASQSPAPSADRGVHCFTYALYAHEHALENSDVVRQAAALHSPVYMSSVKPQEGSVPSTRSFVEIQNAPMLVGDWLKQSEDGTGVVLRLYESGRSRGVAKLQFGPAVLSVQRTDMIEQNGKELSIVDNCVEIAFRPFEIITLKIAVG